MDIIRNVSTRAVTVRVVKSQVLLSSDVASWQH